MKKNEEIGNQSKNIAFAMSPAGAKEDSRSSQDQSASSQGGREPKLLHQYLIDPSL